MYTYFVSYYYTKRNQVSGFGNMVLEKGRLLNSFEDVSEIQEYIKDNYNCQNVTIISFQLLFIDEGD